HDHSPSTRIRPPVSSHQRTLPARALIFLRSRTPTISTLFPYTTLFRSLTLRHAWWLASVGRLKPGWTIARVNAQINAVTPGFQRSEEPTSELQSPDHLVCRLLPEKNKRYISHQTLLTIGFFDGAPARRV